MMSLVVDMHKICSVSTPTSFCPRDTHVSFVVTPLEFWWKGECVASSIWHVPRLFDWPGHGWSQELEAVWGKHASRSSMARTRLGRRTRQGRRGRNKQDIPTISSTRKDLCMVVDGISRWPSPLINETDYWRRSKGWAGQSVREIKSRGWGGQKNIEKCFCTPHLLAVASCTYWTLRCLYTDPLFNTCPKSCRSTDISAHNVTNYCFTQRLLKAFLGNYERLSRQSRDTIALSPLHNQSTAAVRQT